MKRNVRLDKVIKNLVDQCFDNQGRVKSKRALEISSELSKLTSPHNIEALTVFSKKLKIQLEASTLVIESATTVSNDQAKKIANSFKGRTISDVKTVINKDLVGGLRVRLGDMVFDDSIEARIQQVGSNIR